MLLSGGDFCFIYLLFTYALHIISSVHLELSRFVVHTAQCDYRLVENSLCPRATLEKKRPCPTRSCTVYLIFVRSLALEYIPLINVSEFLCTEK